MSMDTNIKTSNTKKPPKKVAAPRNKDDREPIMRQGPRSEVLEKKIVDVYIPPTPCWNPISVRNAIDQHDRGQSQMSGRLADTMTRDSRVQACLHTLVFGILALPFEWKWSTDESSDGGEVLSDIVYKPTEEDLRCLEITKRWWCDFTNSSILASVLTYVVNIGYASMSKNWVLESDYKESGEDLYIPQCWVFHPSNVWYNTGTYEYYITTFEKGLLIVNDSNNDERIQIIKHANSERPWIEGIVRSVGFLYLDKWYALNDWRVYITNNANPLRVLTTIREDSSRGTGSGDGSTDIEDTLVNIARHQQLGLPVHLPEGHKLDLLQANTTMTADIFEKKIKQADTEIAIAYLGQNLTTEVQGGSHAAAKVHESVLHDRIKAYTKTLNSAIQLLVKEFYRYNFAPNVRVPVPCYNAEPPEDTDIRIESANKKADTLLTLASVLEKSPALLSKEELDMLKKEILSEC